MCIRDSYRSGRGARAYALVDTQRQFALAWQLQVQTQTEQATGVARVLTQQWRPGLHADEAGVEPVSYTHLVSLEIDGYNRERAMRLMRNIYHTLGKVYDLSLIHI